MVCYYTLISNVNVVMSATLVYVQCKLMVSTQNEILAGISVAVVEA